MIWFLDAWAFWWYMFLAVILSLLTTLALLSWYLARSGAVFWYAMANLSFTLILSFSAMRASPETIVPSLLFLVLIRGLWGFASLSLILAFRCYVLEQVSGNMDWVRDLFIWRWIPGKRD